MTLLPSVASATDRYEYMRRVSNMPIVPSANGAVNQDSVIYLAKFALGQANNLFQVSGAIRCSGATDSQIKAIIEILIKISHEEPDVDSILQRITDELGVLLVPQRTFPSLGSQPVPENERVVNPIKISSGLNSHGISAAAQDDVKSLIISPHQLQAQEEKVKDQKSAPLSTFITVIFSLVLAAVFLGFFVLWAKEGWAVAVQKNPGGEILFFVVLGALYIVSIPWLKDKGYSIVPNIMFWVAIVLGSLFFLTLLPSCNDQNVEFPVDRPYRK